jgi:hypothetical protein
MVMLTGSKFRRLCQEWPMHSNALIYSGYAIAATLAVQISEQWKDQPMNVKNGINRGKENGSGQLSQLRWSWQFRNGNDPDLVPNKDPSEPYYNFAISAYRSSPHEARPSKKSNLAQCQSADESAVCSDSQTGKTPVTELHECTFNIDLSRVAGMMFYSCCFAGPANALLYPFYHRVFGATSAGVNRSVLFDQTFYMPMISIPACWYMNNFMKQWAMRDPRLDGSKEGSDGEGKQSMYSIEHFLAETTYEMKERWVSTVLMTMAIWIPAESINLRFTPLHLRAVVAGAVGLVWTTGMAAWTHAGSWMKDTSTNSAVDSGTEGSIKSSMKSGVESGMEPSSMDSAVDSAAESWVSIRNLLARISDTYTV